MSRKILTNLFLLVGVIFVAYCFGHDNLSWWLKFSTAFVGGWSLGMFAARIRSEKE